MKKITLFLFALLLYPAYSWEQIDLCLPVAAAQGGAITAQTRDWEAIGINPANLGRENNHKFSITILNVGLSIESDALNFEGLKNAFTHPADTFSMAEKQQLKQAFSTPNGLNLYGDVNWLAFSFYFPKVGGFAVNLRERVTAHLTLSPTAADIMFNGLNSAAYLNPAINSEKISQVLNGTNFSYYHYRELNLDYGKELFSLGGDDKSAASTATASSGIANLTKDDNAVPTENEMSSNAFKMYGGLGIKYIWGLANVYADAENGTIVAHSAVSSSYGINYGDIPGFNSTSVGNLFNNTGHGYGLDVGLSASYKKWRFAVSATDLGSIVWQHNTLTTVDTNMPKLNPNNYGINSWTNVSDFAFSSNSVLNFKPGPDYSVALAAKLRSGVSYVLDKYVTISADAVFPLNKVLGNLENPYYALAGQFTITKGVTVCLGFAGSGTYGFEMPLGFSLGLRNILVFYLGTSDILTYLGRQNNPNISVAMGLLRFNL